MCGTTSVWAALACTVVGQPAAVESEVITDDMKRDRFKNNKKGGGAYP